MRLKVGVSAVSSRVARCGRRRSAAVARPKPAEICGAGLKQSHGQTRAVSHVAQGLDKGWAGGLRREEGGGDAGWSHGSKR